MLRTIRKVKANMEKEIGRTPSLPELAHRLEMPIEKLQLYTDSSRTVLSLEVPLSRSSKSTSMSTLEDDKRTLGEKIACTEQPSPEEDAAYDALRADIRAAIDGLGNDRERDVLIARFGLEDGNPRTLEETAKRLGLSRDRVRMVEARALNKLRHPQRNYKLKVYVGSSPNGGPADTTGPPAAGANFIRSSTNGMNPSRFGVGKASSLTMEHWSRIGESPFSVSRYSSTTGLPFSDDDGRDSTLPASGTSPASPPIKPAENNKARQGARSPAMPLVSDDERDTLSKFSPEEIWSI